MKLQVLALVSASLLWSVSPALADATYCIYLRSSVTHTEVQHTCRWFKSLSDCQKAAQKIGGYCKKKG